MCLTPVDYGKSATLGQKVDFEICRYFSWGDKEIVVAQSGEGVLTRRFSQEPWWLTVLKVISYATVVIPLLLLGLHGILRCQQPAFSSTRSLEEVLAQDITTIPDLERQVTDAMGQLLDGDAGTDARYGIQDRREKQSYHYEIHFGLKKADNLRFQLWLGPNGKDPVDDLDHIWQKWQRVERVCLEEQFTEIALHPISLLRVSYQGKIYPVLVQRPIPREWRRKGECVMEAYAQIKDETAMGPLMQQLATLVFRTGISPFVDQMPLVRGKHVLCKLYPHEIDGRTALCNVVALARLDTITFAEANKRGIADDEIDRFRNGPAGFLFRLYSYYQANGILDDPKWIPEMSAVAQAEILSQFAARPSPLIHDSQWAEQALRDFLQRRVEAVGRIRNPNNPLSLHRGIANEYPNENARREWVAFAEILKTQSYICDYNETDPFQGRLGSVNFFF